jgi:hypothetical protein
MYKTLTDSELKRLGKVLSSYGRNTLLYVALAEHGRQHGQVELVGPGLYKGYIKRFTFSTKNELVGPAHPLFLDVCRGAYRLLTESGWLTHQEPRPSEGCATNA